MGDPRKQRKKYAKPLKRWNDVRIEEERGLLKEYGLKNKQELWRVTSLLRKIKGQAKSLVANKGDPQAEKEKELFFKRMQKLTLIKEGAKLEDVLDLEVKDLLSRSLQNQVVKMGLARTVKQARQFIVHGHIAVGNKKVSVPSYFVIKGEENGIKFSHLSPFMSEDHPERIKKAAIKPVKVVAPFKREGYRR